MEWQLQKDDWRKIALDSITTVCIALYMSAQYTILYVMISYSIQRYFIAQSMSYP